MGRPNLLAGFRVEDDFRELDDDFRVDEDDFRLGEDEFRVGEDDCLVEEDEVEGRPPRSILVCRSSFARSIRACFSSESVISE